jgi:SAM-dependent methyltransferase
LMFQSQSECRSCGSTALKPFLSLGELPLTAAFVREDQLGETELRFPLTVAFCEGCSLVQTMETISPEVIFGRDYPYYSSFSDALLLHSRENALSLIESRRLGAGSLVVELASNDGYLLRNFVEHGVPVLGIDPAEGPAKAAEEAGIRTLREFFGEEMARRLREEGKAADVIIANNVLAHVPDLNGFVEGISILLKDDGVAVIEAPYVRNLVESCEFDTIYHEHLCYFSVTALSRLFEGHGLHLNRVEHLPIHGGSLRLHAGQRRQPDASVQEYLDGELAAGMTDFGYYRHFAERVHGVRDGLLRLLGEAKSADKRVAAYGAAAKGCVLLNFAGVGAEQIDFVADRNVHKQGMYMPGVRIPVMAPEALLSEMPDYVLLLAWNFKDEIIRQQDEYKRRGGQFIVPIPSPEVLA